MDPDSEEWRAITEKVGCRLVSDKPVLVPRGVRVIGIRTSHGHTYGPNPVHCLGKLYDRETGQDLGR